MILCSVSSWFCVRLLLMLYMFDVNKRHQTNCFNSLASLVNDSNMDLTHVFCFLQYVPPSKRRSCSQGFFLGGGIPLQKFCMYGRHLKRPLLWNVTMFKVYTHTCSHMCFSLLRTVFFVQCSTLCKPSTLWGVCILVLHCGSAKNR